MQIRRNISSNLPKLSLFNWRRQTVRRLFLQMIFYREKLIPQNVFDLAFLVGIVADERLKKEKVDDFCHFLCFQINYSNSGGMKALCQKTPAALHS